MPIQEHEGVSSFLAEGLFPICAVSELKEHESSAERVFEGIRESIGGLVTVHNVSDTKSVVEYVTMSKGQAKGFHLKLRSADSVVSEITSPHHNYCSRHSDFSPAPLPQHVLSLSRPIPRCISRRLCPRMTSSSRLHCRNALSRSATQS